MKLVRFLVAVSVFALAEVGFAQVFVGPNVDIVANDPYNQKQVEVAAAVNPLNPSHIFAGYIDYQTIANEDPAKSPTSRGVCGFSFSTNGGKTWRNGLVPAPPDREKCGDPAVAWDTNRHVFYFGLVQRLDGIREMTVWRFTDRDDGTGTLQYDFMVQVDTGTPGAELDKNSLIFQPDATSPDPGAPGTLYACYASLQGEAKNNIKVLCAISRNSGASWSLPNQGKYNGNLNSNNGTAAAPGPGGSIYLFWRAFAAGENGIYMVKASPDGNATTPAMVVGGAGFHPMDMPTRADLARSNAFPAVASDGNQKILLTFQAFSDQNGDMAPPSVSNTSRIFGTYTTNGGMTWSVPKAIDYGPHPNTVQFMPSTVHSGGVYSVIYYDGRNDGCVTEEGILGPESGTGVCGTGRPNNLVTEGYFPTGNDRRFELRVAQGQFDTSGQLSFASSTQVTQYDTQSSSDPLPHPLVPRNANCGPGGCYPGLSYQFLRVGGGGSVAWTGDYIAHVAKVPLLRNLPTAANPPAWRHSRPGDPSTVLAFWPDFSKVAFPLNASGVPDINAVVNVGGQNVSAWTQFVPAGFSPCVNPKTRDVRVLFAEITNRGLLVSVKATSRQPIVGAPIPPEFAVTVQNLTGETIFVRLTLTESVPAEDWSLRQTLPDEPSDDLNRVDLKVMRNSSVTQMIYYRSSGASPTAPALVSVQQLTGRLLDDSADCPIPDPQDPPQVAPVCVPGGSLVPDGLAASAMYNVTSSSLPIGTPHGVLVSTPVVTSFSSASDQPSNSRIDNSRIDNSRIDNSRIDNSRIDNSLVPDQQILWTVTGAGALTTATTAFSQVANGQTLLENGWAFQLLIYQTQLNPNVDGCALTSTATDVVLSNVVITEPNGTYSRIDNSRIDNFQVSASRIDNSRIDNSRIDNSRIDNAAVEDSPLSEQVSNATTALDTSEEATIVLRAFKPEGSPYSMVVCQNPSETGQCPQSDQVAQAVFGQAANVDPVTGRATFVQASFDSTPPEITYVLNPAPNAAGWNNTNVTVTWSVIDPQSGILSRVGCDDAVVTTAGTTTVTCSATNRSTTPDVDHDASETATINIDRTPPSITGSRTPSANANGWNNTNVTVGFACTDSLSGLAVGSPPANRLVSGEGANQAVTGTCSDKAGNSVSATVSGINIDKTPPTSPTISAPATGSSYLLNAAVASSYSCSDALSGIASCAGPVTSGSNFSATSLGSNTFSVTATDKAGNTATAAAAYYVVYSFVLTPPKSPASSGSAVPLTWQLKDAKGALIADLSSLITLTSYYRAKGTAACTLDTSGELARLYSPATGATGGSDFRFIQSSLSYRFNWASPTRPGCYTLVWQLKDNAGPAPDYVVLKPSLLKMTSIELK